MMSVSISSRGSTKDVPATPSQRYSSSTLDIFAGTRVGTARPNPKPEVLAVKIKGAVNDPDLRPDMILRHQCDGFRLEVALAVQRAAVHQHLRETGIVADRADHACAAGLPAPRQRRIHEAGDRVMRSCGIGSAMRGRCAASATKSAVSYMPSGSSSRRFSN